MRWITASVGLTRPLSIWLSIERLTPEAPESCSSDQPRSERSCLMRRQMLAEISAPASGGADGACAAMSPPERFFLGLGILFD